MGEGSRSASLADVVVVDEVAVYTFEVNDGQAPSAESYEDEVRGFFVESYHLKDWLRNDPAAPMGDQETEAAVNKSISLRLCGDLANGAKHVVLSSDPRRPPKVAC